MEREYVLCLLFKRDLTELVMLRKNRSVYAGKLNFVGGKIDPEDILNVPHQDCTLFKDGSFPCCYYVYNAVNREVKEETALTLSDLHFMLSISFYTGTLLHVFYAVLNKGDSFTQIEDESLCWVPVERLLNSVNDEEIAGEGNNAFFTRLALNMIEGVDAV